VRAPERRAVGTSEQLHTHPEPLPGRLHGPGQDVGDRELTRGSLGIHAGAVVPEHGRRGTHSELADAGEPGDDGVRHTDGEQARVARDTKGAKGQHGHADRSRCAIRRGSRAEPDGEADGGGQAECHPQGDAPIEPPPGRRAVQCLGELPGIGITIGRDLGERAAQGGLDPRRNGVAQPAHRRDGVHQSAGSDHLGGGAGVGRLADQHLVQHAPQRVDVGSRVHRWIAGRLFGTHVRRGSQRETRGGEPSVVVRHQLGDAEVGQQRVAAAEQNVLRLHVPVDDALAPGPDEGVGDLTSDRHRLVHRELVLAREPGAERLPLDTRHGEPQEPGAIRECSGAAVEHRQNVGVLQPGGEADLAKEALGAKRGGQLGTEGLEGHRPVVAQVVSQPDLRHAAPAKLALEPVAILESRLHAPGVEHGRDLVRRGQRPTLYGLGQSASTWTWNRTQTGDVILGLH
jgi:hypothetical protein